MLCTHCAAGLRQEELVYLKALWDMVATVMGKFAEWCDTVWDAIAVDDLVEAAKQLTKDLKTLPKPCRAYDVYRYVLVLVSLPHHQLDMDT